MVEITGAWVPETQQVFELINKILELIVAASTPHILTNISGSGENLEGTDFF